MNINVKSAKVFLKYSRALMINLPQSVKNVGGRLKRLISLSAFHLKGAGWYETDYGKKKISEPKELKDQASGEAVADTGASSENASVTSETGPSDPAKVFDSIKSDTKKATKKTKD